MSDLKEGDKVYYKEGFWFEPRQILRVVKDYDGDLCLEGKDFDRIERWSAAMNASHEWERLEGYFQYLSNPQQQEVDMFNMLFGTQFTKEDLQFDN